MPPIQLKGGFTTQDPRLDRVPQFDPRSRQYSVRERLTTIGLRSKTWALPLRLDQGNEGACTGFARAYDLAAAPKPVKDVSADTAHKIYILARQNDEWPGEDYDGSSVLGAVKAARILGYIGEFRWAFSIDEYLAAVAHVGPVVNGTVWKDSMFNTDLSGLLDTSGKDAGGHSYLTRGIIVPVKGVVTMNFGLRRVRIKTDEPLLRGPNSWGPDWGVNGEWVMKASQMEALLKERGEACISTVAFSK